MPDVLHAALATPGLIVLIATIFAAGIVRGFAGFGTALIFVPIGNLYLPVTDVIAISVLIGVGGSSALLPRALKTAEVKDVSKLGLASVFTVPIGLWLVTILEQETVRWIAASITGVLLLALLLGWRYRGVIDTPRLFGIGGVSGVIGGLSGLTGPAVILFYLANGASATVVRSNTILFLALLDVVVIAQMAIAGLLDAEIVVVSLLISVPYFVAARIGQALFDPKYEKTYRSVAYVIIALAVLTGLPLWD